MDEWGKRSWQRAQPSPCQASVAEWNDWGVWCLVGYKDVSIGLSVRRSLSGIISRVVTWSGVLTKGSPTGCPEKGSLGTRAEAGRILLQLTRS